MRLMFYGCEKFNQDLNNWNVKKVTDMGGMFYGCSKFNQDLNDWPVKITDKSKMDSIFKRCPLEKNPPKWYLT